MTNAPLYSGVVIVPGDVARTINTFLRAHGDKKAMEHWQISRLSLTRAAAGLAVHRSTLLALRDGIARLDQAAE